jgi:hypothetical protein
VNKIAGILALNYNKYIGEFGDSMPLSHIKVLDAIINCRTGKYGVSIFECKNCGETHLTMNCCGDRHCPSCQNYKNEEWLKKQVDALLPCNYFLITITIPAELRKTALHYPEEVYSAMFTASKDALHKLAGDPKYIGKGKPGFLGVLHTWGRQMVYHPHIHYIVPGGAISDGEDKWLPSRKDFFVPAKALAKIYKAKLRDILIKKGLYNGTPTSVWSKEWVINAKAVGDGKSSLKYLAPYVFRVAISDNRILSYDENSVTFLYKKSGSDQYKKLTLPALEFIRRFFMHVLPSGFMKVRHYGFLNGNCKFDIEKIRELISSLYEIVSQLNKEKHKEACKPQFVCRKCKKGNMQMIFFSLCPVIFSSG